MTQQVLGVDLGRATWLPQLRLEDRQAATSWVRVPIQTANQMLPAVTRLVADLPHDTTPEVVWTLGGSELLVHTEQTSLAASPGVFQVAVVVECDQVPTPATVTVSYAAGTLADPRGLFLATFDTPTGPPEVVTIWGDPLTAFTWETLLTLADRLAAAAGTDAQGRALVPGAIGAEQGLVLLLPTVRVTR